MIRETQFQRFKYSGAKVEKKCPFQKNDDSQSTLAFVYELRLPRQHGGVGGGYSEAVGKRAPFGGSLSGGL